MLRFLREGTIAKAAVAVILIGMGAAGATGAVRTAYGQTTTDLSQMQHDAQDAAYLSRKIDKQTRLIRNLLYATISLVVAVSLAIPLTIRRMQGAGFGKHMALGRLRIRQAELARAIEALEDFKEESVRQGAEFSTLFAEVSRQLKQLDKDLQG